jgi:hypothetical protein
MTDTATKNFWIVDLDEYTPILVTADGKVIVQAGFSLAEEGLDSGGRLKRLVDFIRDTKGPLEDCFPSLTALMPFGVSHRVAEEIVYLAYWKNHRLQFRMDKARHEVVVWTRFPNKPELNCVLDRFAGDVDPYVELQGWLNFFCRIISDHLEIWQIDLIVHKSVYEKLAIPTHTSIFIEVQAGENRIMDDDLACADNHNVSPAMPVPSS